MKPLRYVGLLLDVLLLGASVVTGKPSLTFQMLGLVVGAVMVVAAVFLAAVLSIGIYGNKRPPYPL